MYVVVRGAIAIVRHVLHTLAITWPEQGDDLRRTADALDAYVDDFGIVGTIVSTLRGVRSHDTPSYWVAVPLRLASVGAGAATR